MESQTCQLLFILTIYTQLKGYSSEFYPQPPERGPAPETDGIAITEFCQANSPDIPDGLPKSGTCRNRCGQMMPNIPYYGGIPESSGCSCDQFCVTNKDCCEDLESFCPDEYKKAMDLTSRLHIQNTVDDFQCIQIQSDKEVALMVSKDILIEQYHTKTGLKIFVVVIKACSLIFRHLFWRFWDIGPMDRIDNSIFSLILEHCKMTIKSRKKLSYLYGP